MCLQANDLAALVGGCVSTGPALLRTAGSAPRPMQATTATTARFAVYS